MRFGRWRKPELQTAVALSDREFVASYLTNILFKQRLVEVAEHTHQLGFEGGFAVYNRRSGGFDVSSAVLPRDDWWLYTTYVRFWNKQAIEKNHPSRRFPAHILLEKYDPGLRPRDEYEAMIWRQDPTSYQEDRKDVAFFLHSHPGGRLVPSMGDIGSWGNTESHNPFHVRAILTARNGLVNLLMWRRKKGEPHYASTLYPDPYNGVDSIPINPYQEEYKKWISRNTDSFLEFCSEMGLNAVLARYNYTNNRLYPSASQLAEALTS